MDKESVPLMELERLLASAAGESVRDALLETFEVAASRLRRALESGLPPAEFDLASTGVEALESARLVLLDHPVADDLVPRNLLSPFSLDFFNGVFVDFAANPHLTASFKE